MLCGTFLTLTFRNPRGLQTQLIKSASYLIKIMRNWPDYKFSAELGTTGNLHFHILLTHRCAQEKSREISDLLFRWKRSHGFVNRKEGGYFGYYIYMRKEDLLRHVNWKAPEELYTSIIIKGCSNYLLRIFKGHTMSSLSREKKLKNKLLPQGVLAQLIRISKMVGEVGEEVSD